MDRDAWEGTRLAQTDVCGEANDPAGAGAGARQEQAAVRAGERLALRLGDLPALLLVQLFAKKEPTGGWVDEPSLLPDRPSGRQGAECGGALNPQTLVSLRGSSLEGQQQRCAAPPSGGRECFRGGKARALFPMTIFTLSGTVQYMSTCSGRASLCLSRVAVTDSTAPQCIGENANFHVLQQPPVARLS